MSEFKTFLKINPTYIVEYCKKVKTRDELLDDTIKKAYTKQIKHAAATNQKWNGIKVSKREIDRITEEENTVRFKMPASNKSKGVLSRKSQMRIINGINFMFYFSKLKRIPATTKQSSFNYRMGMITLTLSSKQIHSDAWVKKELLEPFLRILRTQFKVIDYQWKGETQSNGNIHFHINITEYIWKGDIAQIWNTLQEKYGYISRGKSKGEASTRIEAVKNQKYLGAYIAKYISKGAEDVSYVTTDSNWIDGHYYEKELRRIYNIASGGIVPERRRVEGKLWDSNIELKNMKVNTELDNELQRDLNTISKDEQNVKPGQYHTTYIIPKNGLKSLKFVKCNIDIVHGKVYRSSS